MRVLLLTDSDAFAGTEQHMLTLAQGLNELSVDIAIACPGEAPLAQHARSRGVAVIDVPKRGQIDLKAVRVLAGLLKIGEFDIIHAHNGRTAFLAVLALRLARCGRLVVTQHFLTPHHSSMHGLKGVLWRSAHRWMNGNVSQFIAISSSVAQSIIQRRDAPAERVSTVFNGIDEPVVELVARNECLAALGLPAEALLLICAARLQKEKDLPTLILAMAQVVQSVPAAHCVVAGEGSERVSLENQISALGLQRNVHLVGYREDVLQLISAGDVFVLPSRAEPFGLVLLEAMALSKPVVASRAGGPLDIVEDGVTGRLVEPGNATDLATAMVDLMANPDIRNAFGQSGRSRFLELFTASRLAEATRAAYHKALLRV